MKRNVRIKQRDISDCGAACLASVAAHYRLEMPVARIRQYAATNAKGTNALGMVEAAEKLGFQAKGVKGAFEALKDIPKPAIAHLLLPNRLQHYVVIYKVTRLMVTVMDPLDGRFHRIPAAAFKSQWTGVLILLLPGEDFTARNEKVSHMGRFWQLLRPHRAVSAQIVFGAMIYTVLGLSTSIYVQKIIDHVLVQGNKHLLNLLGCVMLGIILLQLFIGNLKSIFALKTGQQIDAQLILGYYKHLLKLPQPFFDTMRVGEITSRISDAVKIRTFINDVATNLLVNVFIVFFAFVLMFTYYWKLALVALGLIPFYGIIYLISNYINKKMQRRLMENSASLSSQLVESLNAIGTIRRFGLEEYTNVKTESRFIKLLKTIYSSGRSNIFLGNAATLGTSAFVVVLLWVGAMFVIDRQLSPGELLSFYALVGYFTGPVISLIEANKSMQDALIAADRLFEIMDLEQEEGNRKIVLREDTVGDIIFNDVSFRYGNGPMLFRHFNLHVERGKITAIVGESGSGKSSLMSLLQNLYPPREGSISIGGVDIKYIEHHSLRHVVSVVPQHIDLFAGTVLENIAIGEYQIDMQKVLDISRQLGMLDFIEKLPQGFETMLGEHGATLSGGQRQRLAIARALYRNPQVLILDEATSSLDPISAQYVQDTLDSLRQEGKTVIVIAHRLNTVMQADKIVVLQNGELAEEGTHEQLLANKNIYSQLWGHYQGLLSN